MLGCSSVPIWDQVFFFELFSFFAMDSSGVAVGVGVACQEPEAEPVGPTPDPAPEPAPEPAPVEDPRASAGEGARRLSHRLMARRARAALCP